MSGTSTDVPMLFQQDEPSLYDLYSHIWNATLTADTSCACVRVFITGIYHWYLLLVFTSGTLQHQWGKQIASGAGTAIDYPPSTTTTPPNHLPTNPLHALTHPTLSPRLYST